MVSLAPDKPPAWSAWTCVMKNLVDIQAAYSQFVQQRLKLADVTSKGGKVLFSRAGVENHHIVLIAQYEHVCEDAKGCIGVVVILEGA